MTAPAEPPPKPPPPESGGLVARALELVAGVTTWKRTAILVALGSAALVGTLLYQHPTWIEETAAHFVTHEPTLAPAGEIAAVLPELRALLRARTVIVFATDSARNEQWLIAYSVEPAFESTLADFAAHRWTSVLPIFTGEQNEMLVRVVDGEIFCTTLAPEQPGLPIVKVLQLTMICAAGIPPGPQALLGYVAAGFGQPLDRPEAARVRAVLRKYGEIWAP